MKLSFINKSICLIILIILIDIQPTVSIVRMAVKRLSLYKKNDKVVVLARQNFTSTVYKSPTAWLVQFYASWCGHCQSYANTYREIAIDTWPWKTIIRVGAINCYAAKNKGVCRRHHIKGYPALRLIPPGVGFHRAANRSRIPLISVHGVEAAVIAELDNIRAKYKWLPHFSPINATTFQELFTLAPPTTKVLMVIVEKEEDFTGRKVMLDFSKHQEELTIFRTTINGTLWHDFNISEVDIPALFVVFRNLTFERIKIQQAISNVTDERSMIVNAIRLYLHMTRDIPSFDDRDFNEVARRRRALEKAIQKAIRKRKLALSRNMTDEIRDKGTIHTRVNMVDLELALKYMFNEEIPEIEEIQGEAYDALVNWLTVLNKYFPGREPVMVYLQQLLLKVTENKQGFKGDEFAAMINVKTLNASLPHVQYSYQHCAGSSPQYRGYPCAAWTIFHTLTVSQYETEPNQTNVTEVLFAIRNYVSNFFGCRECARNFLNETVNMSQIDAHDRQAGILYLWKVHNSVNKRLQGEITEDPKYPKVQFPSIYLCITCKSKQENATVPQYNISETFEFLLEYYSRDFIDTSLLPFEYYRGGHALHQQEILIPHEEQRQIEGAEEKNETLVNIIENQELIEDVENITKKISSTHENQAQLENIEEKNDTLKSLLNVQELILNKDTNKLQENRVDEMMESMINITKNQEPMENISIKHEKVEEKNRTVENVVDHKKPKHTKKDTKDHKKQAEVTTNKNEKAKSTGWTGFFAANTSHWFLCSVIVVAFIYFRYRRASNRIKKQRYMI